MLTVEVFTTGGILLDTVVAADGTVSWPSERYAREYGPHATYPLRTDCPERATAGAATAAWALRREMVDLPERW